MIPVTERGLKGFIEEGKATGKDVSGLEAELAEGTTQKPQMGKTRRVGESVIVSTGPTRSRDFGH